LLAKEAQDANLEGGHMGMHHGAAAAGGVAPSFADRRIIFPQVPTAGDDAAVARSSLFASALSGWALIVGATRPEQLAQNLAALELVLPGDVARGPGRIVSGLHDPDG
jgi:hypothetical protein